MSRDSDTLRVHEWLIVALACGIFCGLAGLTAWRGGYAGFIMAPPEQIQVAVSGAVEVPGTYTVAKDGAVSSLLALAEPLSHANLQQAPKLLGSNATGWRLCIPSHLYVEVELTGALAKPGIYQLPLGTRLCDLTKHVEILPEVDPRWLKRRRLLRTGDQIEIPAKPQLVPAS